MNKKIRILLSEVYEDTIKSVPFATKGSLPFQWKNSELFSATPKNSGKSCCSNTDTSYRKPQNPSNKHHLKKPSGKEKSAKKKKNAGISKVPNPKIPVKNTQSVLFCVD